MSTFRKSECYIIERITGLSHFDDIKWAAQALSTDPNQYVLNNFLIEGSKAVCTDGRRLHVVTNTFFDIVEDGMYEILKSSNKIIVLAKSTFEGSFPNYKQVIPPIGPDTTKFEVHTAQDSVRSVGEVIFKLGKNDAALLHIPYVRNIFSFKSDTVTVHVTDGLSPVLFTDRDRLALIMALRID